MVSRRPKLSWSETCKGRQGQEEFPLLNEEAEAENTGLLLHGVAELMPAKEMLLGLSVPPLPQSSPKGLWSSVLMEGVQGGEEQAAVAEDAVGDP